MFLCWSSHTLDIAFISILRRILIKEQTPQTGDQQDRGLKIMSQKEGLGERDSLASQPEEFEGT